MNRNVQRATRNAQLSTERRALDVERLPASRTEDKIASVFADDTGEHFATIDVQGRLTQWPQVGHRNT